jgi:hypothetical protein
VSVERSRGGEEESQERVDDLRAMAPADRRRDPSGPWHVSADHRVGLIEYLCGSVFCVATGAMIYAENSHFFITEAIAIEASENVSQVANRSHKGDRLSRSMIDRYSRSANQQCGFDMPEVGDPRSSITIKDTNGQLLFELDPQRRTTVISKTRGSQRYKDIRRRDGANREFAGSVARSVVSPIKGAEK